MSCGARVVPSLLLAVGVPQAVSLGVAGDPQAVSPWGVATESVAMRAPVAAAVARVSVVRICLSGFFTSGSLLYRGKDKGRRPGFLVCPIRCEFPFAVGLFLAVVDAVACGEDAGYERRGTPHDQLAVRCCHSQVLVGAGLRSAGTRS